MQTPNRSDARLYAYDKPKPINAPTNKSTVRSNSKISLSTNKFSGKSFADPNASQGIFSNNAPNPISQNSHAPVWNTTVSTNSTKRPNFDIINENLETKRKHETSVENMKFTVVDPKPVVEKIIKPVLLTAKFAQKPDATTAVTPVKFNSLVSPIQGYRIEVKNLHSQVNVDYVFELFTSLGGELRSCNLVRPGYAEVVFRRLVDAEKSIEEFHDRELDGKPMNLKLVTATVESVLNDVSNIDIKNKNITSPVSSQEMI